MCCVPEYTCHIVGSILPPLQRLHSNRFDLLSCLLGSDVVGFCETMSHFIVTDGSEFSMYTSNSDLLASVLKLKVTHHYAQPNS